MQPSAGLVAAISVGIAVSFAGGITSAALDGDHSVSHRASPDRSILDPVPSFSPPPTAAPSTNPALVVGPDGPFTTDPDVRTDLRNRTVELNADKVDEDSDGVVGGGFRTIDTLVKSLGVADEERQRRTLVTEGFEGSELHVWEAREGGLSYLVDLQRFTSEAGAKDHLSGFVHGPEGGESRLKRTTSMEPNSYAFLGPTKKHDGEEFTLYQQRGRYFSILVIVGALDADQDTLATEGARLAKAVRQRMG